jgi:glycosyltransferase involved in cell wall biosynthesis
VVQTKKAGEIYREKFPDNRIEVIGNPFELPKEVDYPNREKIILSVGRLIHTKHYDLLIRYFSEAENDGWKLVIAGGNSVKQDGMSRLKMLVDELQLNEKVELPGLVANVEEWYKRSSIFAFTSSSEGFPNVIGEAMQHGLPVVAFDCIAGPSDLIDDGKNGYLIPLFNSEQYREKLQKLMNDFELRLRMGNNSKEKIKEFSINKIGEKFCELVFSDI